MTRDQAQRVYNDRMRRLAAVTIEARDRYGWPVGHPESPATPIPLFRDWVDTLPDDEREAE